MKRSKTKKQQRMEEQDALGISRQKWKHTMSLKLFVILKFACIVSIPIVYFVYSPLLVVCMGFYVSLFFLSIMAERRVNISVIRSNHIKIPKFDSAIALIIIVISLFGIFLSGTNKVKQANFSESPRFEQISNINFKGIRKNSVLRTIKTKVKNFGSLLTGERSIFGDGKSEFGTKRPPSNFPTDKSDIPSDISGRFPSGGSSGTGDYNREDVFCEDFDFSNRPQRHKFDFSMSDLPVEFMFSSIISTLNTILIFSTCGFGLLSLLALYLKIRKFNKRINEVLVETTVTLTDEEIDKILDFGEKVTN